MGEEQGHDVANALDPEGGSCAGDEQWGESYKTPKGEQSKE